METSLLLFAAGVLGGVVNAVAGGATLITFPAMLASGLPAVTANASNAVAIVPGHLMAAWADRRKLPRLDRAFWRLFASAVAGGGAGAALLLALPERLFILPVPALIGFATALFAAAPWIARRASHRHVDAFARWEPLALAVASVYGGFFGAGLGIVLTALLSLGEPDDIRKVKVLKNVLATAVSLTAIVIFIATGAVAWPQTLTMLAGALLGGHAGGHLLRNLPAGLVRAGVIAAGTGMTLIYAYRYWL